MSIRSASWRKSNSSTFDGLIKKKWEKNFCAAIAMQNFELKENASSCRSCKSFLAPATTQNTVKILVSLPKTKSKHFMPNFNQKYPLNCAPPFWHLFLLQRTHIAIALTECVCVFFFCNLLFPFLKKKHSFFPCKGILNTPKCIYRQYAFLNSQCRHHHHHQVYL